MEKPCDIFVSYAREDERWLTLVKEHLAVLRTQRSITSFSDRDFSYGEGWRRRIAKELEGMRIFLFLVSRHSLGSEFITEHELPAARRRQESEGVIFVPLLVGECAWESSDWLKELVFVRTEDTNYKPVALEALPSEAHANEVLTQMTSSLAELLERQPSEDCDRDFLVKLCDRSPQLRTFEGAARRVLREAEVRVQMWIVYGQRSQALFSFTDRLREQNLKHVPLVTADRERSPAWFEVSDWPDPAEPDPLNPLLWALLERVDSSRTESLIEATDYRAAAAAAFAACWSEMAETASLAGFRHETTPYDSPEALFEVAGAYAKFLAEVVAREMAPDRAGDFLRLPPLLFFLCVPLEEKDSRWSDAAVKVQLDALRGSLNPRHLDVTAFPQLDDVEERHVRDWFRAHGSKLRVPHERQWAAACHGLFNPIIRRRPMLEVEDHLTAFLTQNPDR